MTEHQYVEWKESWGRGIEKIAHECRQHGLEAPLYDTNLSGLMLTFMDHLEKLRRMGLVHRTGTTKGGHWKVLT